MLRMSRPGKKITRKVSFHKLYWVVVILDTYIGDAFGIDIDGVVGAD